MLRGGRKGVKGGMMWSSSLLTTATTVKDKVDFG